MATVTTDAPAADDADSIADIIEPVEPADNDVTAAPDAALADEGDGRDALQLAIARVAEANALVAEHTAAIARAFAFVESAEEAVAAAQIGLEEARRQHAEALAKAASDDAKRPASAVRQARAALVDAEDELESARDALERLRADDTAARELEQAKDALLLARNAVLRPLLRRFIARVAEARHALFVNKQIVTTLFANDVFNGLADLYAAFEHAQAEMLVRGGPHIQAWSRWRQALLADPDAPPPQLDFGALTGSEQGDEDDGSTSAVA
jgi:hypothetical protein